jgi:putative DNA primase/helicase
MDKVAEGVLKQLTTGDPIQANRKHKTPVTLRPTARMIFGTNTLPPFHDRTEGVWRRMIAMPFFAQIAADRKDYRRSERLLDELPGILNWSLEGGVRLFKQNGFTPCEVCEACAHEHRYDCDPFRQFVAEMVYLDAAQSTLSQRLYEAYREFCDANGRYAKNSAEFGKQILELPGVTRQRDTAGSRPYRYVGLGVHQVVRMGSGASHRTQTCPTMN